MCNNNNGGYIPNSCIILDNYSKVEIFSNKHILTDIKTTWKWKECTTIKELQRLPLLEN